MRYLAIDLGEKRTGLAIGDRITGLSVPLGVVEVSSRERDGAALVEAVVRAVEEHLGPGSAGSAGGAAGGAHRGSVGALVVGLPLNMDGTEGPRAKAVRRLATLIGAQSGREVHYQDERLTTAEADWRMARSGRTRKQKKAARDALAAAAILGDFLRGLLSDPDPGGPWSDEPED